MSSRLEPLDLSEEVDKYEAKSEQKNVKFKRCVHKGVKYDNGKLICTCGAVWTGPRLQELFDLLTKKK